MPHLRINPVARQRHIRVHRRIVFIAADAPRHNAALRVPLVRRIANRTHQRCAAVTLTRVHAALAAGAQERRIETELLRQARLAQPILTVSVRHDRQLDALLDYTEFALLAEARLAPAAGEAIATGRDVVLRRQANGANVIGETEGILQFDEGLQRKSGFRKSYKVHEFAYFVLRYRWRAIVHCTMDD